MEKRFSIHVLPECLADFVFRFAFSRCGLLFALAMLVTASSVGCRAYQFGSPTMHRMDVATIHVPIFGSDSYRRFLGQRLTESVIRELELNTPFRIADASTAQSFLNGRILKDDKHALVESINDDPRALQATMEVEINWVDRSGVPLMQRQVLRIDRGAVFIPEAGQSLTTAQQELIDRTARQIIQQMEMPW